MTSLLKGATVLGYFVAKEDMDNLTGTTVMVAIDEGYPDRLTYYSPIGQHSEGSREYLEDCVAISKETYLENNSGCYTPEEYLNPDNLLGSVKNYLMKILTKYNGLEGLCEALDSCFDLYDLGYIDSEVEQDVYEYLAETQAVNLWALYVYANRDDRDYEYTFNFVAEEISKRN